MITRYGWLTDNLEQRLSDPALDYKVQMRPYRFTELDFDTAADFTAKLIHEEHEQLYLALSGGMDSEFMVRRFHKLRIPFKVIIGRCSGIEEELMYALELCQRLKLKPIVVDLTDQDLLKIFQRDILQRFNGSGIYTVTSLAVAEEVANRGGTLVTGKNIIGEGRGLTHEVLYNTNEWDSYAAVTYKNDVGFFNYTQELTYSMICKTDVGLSWQQYKSNLYQINIREKMIPNYNPTVKKLMALAVSSRKHQPNAEFSYGDSSSVRSILEPYLCKN